MATVHRLFALFILFSVATGVLLLSRKPALAQLSDMPPQKIWSAYWTIAPGYTSILEMKNNRAKETLTVYPSLYFRSGQEYPLPPMILPPRQTAVVNLNEALAALPRDLAAQHEGTLEVDFAAPNDHAVMGSVSVTNQSASTAWNFRLYAADPLIPAAPLRGLFWLPNENTKGFIAIQNTSEEFITVSPQFDVDGQSHPIPSNRIAPGSGWKLDLREELHKLHLENAHAGGIELAYQGPGDALQAHEVAFDDVGFSSEVDFLPAQSMDMTQSWALRTPQFAIGKADPRLGLPPDTQFEPTMVLHNFDTVPVSATLAVGFKLGDAPKEKLFPITLSAGESRIVDLFTLLHGVVPSTVHWASMELQYSGQQNSIAADMVSTSTDGRHSIRSVLNWVEGSASDGPFWQVDPQKNTLIAVYNADTEPAQLSFSLDYYVGTEQHKHQLSKITIPPRTTEQIDVGAIISSQQPDAAGDIIPPEITTGGYLVKKTGPRLDHILITEELVFNREKNSYLTFYNTCCPLTNINASPGSLLGAPGDSGQFSIIATSVCSGAGDDVTDSGTFSSQNTSIATVGANNGISNGHVSMVAVGSTNVNWSIKYFSFVHFTPPCLPASSGGAKPLTVVPKITSISPPQGLIGDTLNVVISGTQFGTNPTVSAGAGISVTINASSPSCTNSPTTICANFAISSSITPGNQGVTVTNTVSGTSSTPPTNFFIQVPTSLSVMGVTVLADGSSGACQSADCGIRVDVKYQVLDQQSPPQPIRSTSMSPFETVGGSSGNICPSSVADCTPNTASDGTWHDAPVGFCNSVPATLNVNQIISMVIGATKYQVRTNNYVESSTQSGQGSITNNNDILAMRP